MGKKREREREREREMEEVGRNRTKRRDKTKRRLKSFCPVSSPSLSFRLHFTFLCLCFRTERQTDRQTEAGRGEPLTLGWFHLNLHLRLHFHSHSQFSPNFIVFSRFGLVRFGSLKSQFTHFFPLFFPHHKVVSIVGIENPMRAIIISHHSSAIPPSPSPLSLPSSGSPSLCSTRHYAIFYNLSNGV
jgi:hypothetical protein